MSHPPLETWGLGAALGSFGREGRAPSSGLKGQGYQGLWPNSLRGGDHPTPVPVSVFPLFFFPASLLSCPPVLGALFSAPSHLPSPGLAKLPCRPRASWLLIASPRAGRAAAGPQPQALHGPGLSRGPAGRRGPRSGVCKGLAAKPLTLRGGGSRICWVLFPWGRAQRRRSGGSAGASESAPPAWGVGPGTFPRDFSPQPGAEQAGAARGPRSARPSPARPLPLRRLQRFFCTCLVYI